MTPSLIPMTTDIPIASETDLVKARHEGRALAASLGFSPDETTVVATTVSELARNILQYAAGGDIQLRAVHETGRRGVHVVASDHGPGIPDVPRATAGGYSTSGGLGVGLCGIRRLVDDFEVLSQLGEGTTVILTKWKR